VKYSVPYLLFVLAAVGALLGLEWSETHGGPVIIPPRDIFLVIVLVPSMTSAIYALIRCRPHARKGSAMS
jgi:hypothetical protein